MSDIEFKYTPIEEIEKKVARCKAFYFSKQKRFAQHSDPAKADQEFRLTQLKKLYNSVRANYDYVLEAMFEDFHRAHQESVSIEVVPLLNDILRMIERLPKWMKPKRIRDWSPAFMFGDIKVERIARGCAAVISPFNFPLLLCLTPAANAIAAGNTVVLKPSELTPHTALAIEKVIADANFPEGLVEVVQGAIPENTALINNPKLDMIFYTGSPKVGSIVAQAAAKNLVPCVLELGGKSPTFMTGSFNVHNRGLLRTALKRIMFGAFSNGGQICVSPDYLLVHESIYDKVVEEAKNVLNELFPTFDADLSYTHIINERAYDNLMHKLKITNGEKFVPASAVDFNEKEHSGESYCIPPTIVFNCTWDDCLMREENFGPVLPVIKYADLDKTLDTVVKNHDTPLVQYIFSGSDSEAKHILARIRSGDCLINDTVIHVAVQEAPFGGIGTSGYGNYGGEHGFNAFTHERTVFKQPFWVDKFMNMRYAPYSAEKIKMVRMATEKRPFFDERGQTHWYRRPFVYVASALTLLSLGFLLL